MARRMGNWHDEQCLLHVIFSLVGHCDGDCRGSDSSYWGRGLEFVMLSTIVHAASLHFLRLWFQVPASQSRRMFALPLRVRLFPKKKCHHRPEQGSLSMRLFLSMMMKVRMRVRVSRLHLMLPNAKLPIIPLPLTRIWHHQSHAQTDCVAVVAVDAAVQPKRKQEPARRRRRHRPKPEPDRFSRSQLQPQLLSHELQSLSLMTLLIREIVLQCQRKRGEQPSLQLRCCRIRNRNADHRVAAMQLHSHLNLKILSLRLKA